MHCIPYKFDLTDTLNEKLGQAEECNILSPEKKFNNEFSYIYIESEKNGNKIYRVEKLPSQFLRREVFEKQGSQEYKWQEKCITLDSVKNSKKTIEDLKDKIFIE